MQKSLRTPQHQRLIEALIGARKAAQLTQADVAGRLSRPQSFVAKYEGGERRLDVIEFLEIAQALDTNPSAILDQMGVTA